MSNRSRNLLVPVLLAAVLAACSSQLELEPAQEQRNSVAINAPISDQGGVRVMTLNAAHSRGTGFHQILQDGDTARENLATIAAVIEREAPDVLALQELDGPSFWSGGFDHAEFLSERSGLPSYLRADNQKLAGLRYGTALMSRYTLADGEGFSFPARGVWPAKGFVVSTMETGAADYPSVTVVSVHLDPLRPTMRHKQLRMLAQHLDSNTEPTIVMGDFNCEWEEDTCLQWFTSEMQLQAHAPAAPDLGTFRFGGKRLDWVLASRHFGFSDYKVLTDDLSDHRGVVAELHWLPQPDDPQIVADGEESRQAGQVLSR